MMKAMYNVYVCMIRPVARLDIICSVMERPNGDVIKFQLEVERERMKEIIKFLKSR